MELLRARLLTITYFTIIAAVLVVPYGELVKRAQTNELAFSTRNKQLYLSDFVQFYTCGKLVLEPSTRTRIYDPAAINKAMPVAVPMEDRIIPAVPFFIVLMAPWALLPVDTSFLVWILLSAICMAGGSLLLLRGWKEATPLACLGFLTAILMAQPSWFTLFIGHACFYQYFFLSLFFFALLHKKDALAGAGMALASFKPQFAIPLLVPALAGRRFKLLAWGAAFELGLLALSVFTVGLDNTIHFPALIAKYEHDQSRVVPRMICLRAIIERVLPHQATMLLSWALFALSLAMAYYLWRRTMKNQKLWPLAASFTITAGLVFSPHAHVYDAVMMGLVAIMLLPVNGLFGFASLSRTRKLLCTSLMLYPMASWYFFVGISEAGNMIGYPFAVLDLLILLGILAVFKEENRQEETAPKPET